MQEPEELDPSDPENLLFHAFHGSDISDAHKVLAANALLTALDPPEEFGFKMVVPNNGYCIIEDVAKDFLEAASEELGVERDRVVEHCETKPTVSFRKKTQVRKAWQVVVRHYHQQKVYPKRLQEKQLQSNHSLSEELFAGFRKEIQACMVPSPLELD